MTESFHFYWFSDVIRSEKTSDCVLLTLFTVTSLFVVGGDAPLDFEVGGRLAIELAVGPRFGQRQVAAGGRLAGLQLGHKQTDTHTHTSSLNSHL